MTPPLGQTPTTVELHVGAMPFPTRQGTQAVVHAMLEARKRAGHDAHLLTYAEGEEDRPTSYVRHRSPSLRARDAFRSGPSTAKLLDDLTLLPTIGRVSRKLRPDTVVAHHVEAAALCVATRKAPLIFFAHTAIGPELPTYAHDALAPFLSRAGEGLDRALCRSADRVAAISPMLRDAMQAQLGADVAYIPPPWTVPAPITVDERERSRRALCLAQADEVILYAGNLDAYQGWECAIEAFARLRRTRPNAQLLLATASNPSPARLAAARAGVAEALRVVDLPGDEAGRRQLHAAATVVLVPRRTPGGLPIKLLDALARGVPTVAVRRAGAGLALDRAALLTRDDDAEALAAGLATAVAAPRAVAALGERARAYVEHAHAPRVFSAALDRLVSGAAETFATRQRLSRNATRSSMSSLLR